MPASFGAGVGQAFAPARYMRAFANPSPTLDAPRLGERPASRPLARRK